MTAVLVSLLSLLPAAWAHGNMQVPPTWFDPAGQLGANNRLQCGGVFSACDWFTNFTFTPGPPTLPPALWTYTKLWDPHQPVFHPSRLRYHKEKSCMATIPTAPTAEILSNEIPELKPIEDYFSRNPWRSPGSALVHRIAQNSTSLKSFLLSSFGR